MYKQIIVLLSLMITSTYVFAETCPALSDIQKNKLAGWQMIDSDDGTPLSLERQANFLKSIKQFALAESVQLADKKNEIHCYYHDANGAELEAYLSKADLVPKNINEDWYQVSGGMDCAASIEECVLQKKINETAQFANNTTTIDQQKAG